MQLPKLCCCDIHMVYGAPCTAKATNSAKDLSNERGKKHRCESEEIETDGSKGSFRAEFVQ